VLLESTFCLLAYHCSSTNAMARTWREYAQHRSGTFKPLGSILPPDSYKAAAPQVELPAAAGYSPGPSFQRQQALYLGGMSRSALAHCAAQVPPVAHPVTGACHVIPNTWRLCELWPKKGEILAS